MSWTISSRTSPLPPGNWRETLSVISATAAPMRENERLNPEALSKQFGVSRTPIREAIQPLSISGLVVVLAKKGAFIAKVSFD